MGSLLVAAAGGLLLYVAVGGALWLLQPYLVFHPGPPPTRTPEDVGLQYEAVELRTSDGVRLAAWFLPGPGGDTPTVLFLHGNAGNIGDRLESLLQFHEAGAAVLIPDYRGFGESEGQPTEEGVYRDALAAWRWLTVERRIPRGRIVVFGRSLGGAVAAFLAARRQPAGLVLESTFTSLPDVAARQYPWLPARRLTRYRFDTASYLAKVDAPTLLAHAPADELIPFDHARALNLMRPPVIELLRLDGGHNDAFIRSQPGYTERLATFFSRVTGPSP